MQVALWEWQFASCPAGTNAATILWQHGPKSVYRVAAMRAEKQVPRRLQLLPQSGGFGEELIVFVIFLLYLSNIKTMG